MKKIFLAAIILFTLVAPNYTSAATKSINLKVNNVQTKSTYNPFESNGTTYVPINIIAEKMGSKVKSNSTKKSVEIEIKNGVKISLKANQTTATVKGKKTPLKTKTVNKKTVNANVKSVYKNKQIFVPVQFLSSSKGMGYSVKTVKTTIYVGKLPESLKDPVGVKQYGHATATQKVFNSESIKSKSLGSIEKNQNVYIYTSHNGWYQVKYGSKKGWISQKSIKLGKRYYDGWEAPVLKSSWSSNRKTNLKTLQNELGFSNGGKQYDIKGVPGVIQVSNQGSSGSYEVGLTFYMWEDNADGYLKEAYRVPIIAKELFKLYFGKDADRVWDYFNKNDIPKKFIANGRTVKATFSEVVGAMYLEVGKK